jgi:hypothetical protein
MKSLLIVALLVVGAFAVAVPSPALASTGHATLVASTSQTTPFTSAHTTAAFNLTIPWGSALVSTVDGAAVVGTNYLVIDLSGVVFSGAQFALYISPNGFSQINSSTDYLVSPTFNVTSLGGAAQHIGSYYLGTDTVPFISGPITSTSVEIPGGVYYIKIFDGLTTAVAVSSQFIMLLPSISIKPTSGPAGADLTVTGHGFSANGVVNLSIQYPLGTFKGTANVTADALGHFSVSTASLGFRVPDLQIATGAAATVPSDSGPVILPWPWTTELAAARRLPSPRTTGSSCGRNPTGPRPSLATTHSLRQVVHTRT